jgi:hypothetical protein
MNRSIGGKNGAWEEAARLEPPHRVGANKARKAPLPQNARREDRQAPMS